MLSMNSQKKKLSSKAAATLENSASKQKNAKKKTQELETNSADDTGGHGLKVDIEYVFEHQQRFSYLSQLAGNF